VIWEKEDEEGGKSELSALGRRAAIRPVESSSEEARVVR
jgi:hypothetical protein